MRLSYFGLKNGINEVIVVTYGVNDKSDKGRNTAPIGIIVENDESLYAKVRLYNNHTRKNVEAGSKIYVNVCFDPIIFAISAFEDLDDEYFSDDTTLKDCYSHCVFEVCKSEIGVVKGEVRDKIKEIKEYKLRLLGGRIVNKEHVRAFNRGFAAVVECAVHATRFIENRNEKLKRKIIELGKIIEKCGGCKEKKAYSLILRYSGIKKV